MTRILIADDHDVVRSGVRSILECHEGWEVVGEAKDGKEAIDLALATRPDVVVLDYALPLVNGVEATRQIRTRVPGAEVLIFTMHDTDSLVRDVLEAGARGFLLKSDARQFLISAVESLAAHKPFFTGKVSETLLETYLSRGSTTESALSAREKAVVQLISRGKDQQADRRHPQHQHQDSRDPSRNGHAQTQSGDDGRADPIRDPERVGRGVNMVSLNSASRLILPSRRRTFESCANARPALIGISRRMHELADIGS